MIDRYTITALPSILQDSFGAPIPDDYQPRYNAAPTQSLPVITNSDPKHIKYFQWGLISNLANNKKLSPRLFNLPVSSALSRPSYRKSLVSNRCMILADGFYIWKPIAKKRVAPYYVTPVQKKPFLIAGIWEEADPFSETQGRSFMLITTDSSSEINPYQDDMPMILSDKLLEFWSSDIQSIDDLPALVQNNSSPEFMIHAVSPLITRIELDLKDMIEPASPSDQHGNYTLFG